MFSLLVLTDFPRTLCLYFSSAVQFSMTGRPEKVARCSLSGASQAPFFAAARLLYHFHSPLSTLFSLKIRLFSRFFRESRTGGLFFAESAKSTDKGMFIKKTETSGACHAVRLSVPARLKKDDPGGGRGPRPELFNGQPDSAGERVFYDHGMMVARPVAVDHLVAHTVKRHLRLVSDHEDEVDRRRGLPV